MKYAITGIDKEQNNQSYRSVTMRENNDCIVFCIYLIVYLLEMERIFGISRPIRPNNEYLEGIKYEYIHSPPKK